MFWRKVKCDTCKCWLDKKDAQKVTTLSTFVSFDRYFCGSHKKPYDHVYVHDGASFYKTIPEHSIEVDINGIEVKPKKK